MTEAESKPERYVRPPSAESLGEAPGRDRLKGRRILIVGGGQRVFDAATDPIGNGRAMSILCAREGAKVAVADLNHASAQQTVKHITGEGGEGFAIVADVTREADVISMIDEAHRAMGGLDGMVLNIGTFGKIGLDNVSPEEWNRIYDVNVRGPMLCRRAAMPKFDNGGSVVFISSIAALKAGSQMAVYDSSKAALGGLMRNIAHLGSRRGIRANPSIPASSTPPTAAKPALAAPTAARATSPSAGRRQRGRSPTPCCSSCRTKASTSPHRPSQSIAA